MEQFEKLRTVGEGTYGLVYKARHKPTGIVVAVKRFRESKDSESHMKILKREIKMLQVNL